MSSLWSLGTRVRGAPAGEGIDPLGGPPERFRNAIKRDAEKWKKVVKQAKITLQS